MLVLLPSSGDLPLGQKNYPVELSSVTLWFKTVSMDKFQQNVSILQDFNAV